MLPISLDKKLKCYQSPQITDKKLKCYKSPQISVKKGTEMILLKSNNKDWWKVDHNGRIGFLPTAYLKTLPPENEVLATTY